MRIIVFTCIFITSLMPAMAGNTYFGWGVVNMQGAIIDTACAIAIESRDQSIDMDVVPLADITRDGQGRRKPFSIELVNCELERQQGKKPTWTQFQVTFDGDAEGDLFGVRGEASGIALQITDELGNIALPGRPLPREDIFSGNMRLNYNLRLVANQHALKAGDYFSSIRFKLDYF
ncbi:PAP fimbrial minor pilin protein precursor [Serratia entomophila]|nr:PAP fimbrial minor pilin protein precursor [Serratia entomophila]CAI1749125.1 PAP fimbrial minor pilin protein precursor [Serratia entomophila]